MTGTTSPVTPQDAAGSETDPAAHLLSVTGLTVRYGKAIVALQDINMSVRPGTITAVLGGNGAGKTTLMRTISGTLHRHGGAVLQGDISFAGRSLNAMATEHRTRLGVGQVPEGRRVFGRLTVEENLRVGRFGSQKGKRGELQHVYELFPVLATKRKQQAALLSGGEQQMLAIGRGLMASPEILLLDEPTLGLAPRIIDQIAELLARIRAEGTTLLLVEQNAGVALDLADYAYVFSSGELAIEGAAAALKSDDRVRRLYLGESIDDEPTAPAEESL